MPNNPARTGHATRSAWLGSLLLALALALPVPALADVAHPAATGEGPAHVVQGQQPITASVTAEQANVQISKYGNVILIIPHEQLLGAFAYGDIVTVSFLDTSVDVPLCSNYSDVDSGEAVLRAKEGSDLAILAINAGNFAGTYGVATKNASGAWSLAERAGGEVSFTISEGPQEEPTPTPSPSPSESDNGNGNGAGSGGDRGGSEGAALPPLLDR